MMIVNNRLLILVLATILPTLPGALLARPVPSGIAALREHDSRVLVVGHRLAVAARDLCRDQNWLPGFTLHDLAQYGPAERAAVAAAFGLERGPGVLALVPGGPAARGGLQLNDVLIALDGRPLGRGEMPVRASFAQLEEALDEIDRAFADGQAMIRIERDGAVMDFRIQAEAACASRFQVIPSGRLNAYADGRYVQVTSAMAAFADSEEALAAVLAHELAHNILGHRAQLDAAGVQRGVLRNFGRNARLIRGTEIAADRLGVRLMDRAGYDLRDVPAFWRRFSRQGLNFMGSPTHGVWSARIARMEAEISALQESRAQGEQP